MRRCMAMMLVSLFGVSLAAFAQTALPTAPAPAPAPAPTPAPPAAKPSDITVTDGTKGSTIKLDGRIFTDFTSTQKDGSSPRSGFDIPDAKFRVTYAPSKDITAVTRMNFKTDGTDTFDYLYVDVNNFRGALPGQTIRVGRQKIDFGEETWTDNPEESITINNSAGIVNGYGTGVDFRGRLDNLEQPIFYSAAILNGTNNVAAPNHGVALAGKAAIAPLDNLYFSGSVYQGTGLGKTQSDLKIAGIQDMPDTSPTSTTNWKRSAWELDGRWNYGTTGVKSQIGSDPAVPYQLAAAYGQFKDDVVAGTAANRDGKYYYIEGLYNATPDVFLAARYSQVSLDNGATAKFNSSPVAVNKYNRTSLGIGYRYTPLTQIKAEYTINKAEGGASEPKINQFTVGIATKF